MLNMQFSEALLNAKQEAEYAADKIKLLENKLKQIELDKVW